MESEEDKQSSNKNPYTELEQVSSDFIIALSLQEQDTTFTMLTTLERGDGSSFDNDDDDDGDFFVSQEFETNLQFIESEGSNNDEEIEEDYIDPEELSYEELIELGDFIGEEKRGLSANEVSFCIRSCSHSAESKSGINRCVICQVEYEEGEALVALHCEHPYHTDCISKWLQIKKVCPICSSEISVLKMAKNP